MLLLLVEAHLLLQALLASLSFLLFVYQLASRACQVLVSAALATHLVLATEDLLAHRSRLWVGALAIRALACWKNS